MQKPTIFLLFIATLIIHNKVVSQNLTDSIVLRHPKKNMRTIKVNDQIIGGISKFVMENDAEITYGIDRKFWGQRFATATLKDFLKIEQIRPIYARGAFDNYSSQKVLEKFGFIRIGKEKGFADARQT